MPRSPSPSRDRERDRRDRSASPRRDRDEPSAAKPWSQRRAKELSFYKKSSHSSSSYSGGRGTVGDVGEEETAKERAQRRERGEVPKRFGGSREQGVRNTMGNVAASAGSLKRSGDPLDRLGVRGSGRDRDGGRERESRTRDERERGERSERSERRDREGGRDRRDGDRDRDRRGDSGRDREERDMRHPDRREQASTSTTAAPPAVRPGRFIEVIANDRMGRKVRVKCLPTDTVGDLKKLIAAQTGTSAQKIVLKKWYTSYKDHVTLQDYEINDGMSLEMY